MTLSASTIRTHIDYWEDRLKKGAYPYRKYWPARLFRHEPLENVVKILSSGQLLSRNDSLTVRSVDVADADVLGTTTAAYSAARLYFRPKNPTQYWIEGIRKPLERRSPTAHAPVLYILLFRAEPTLSTAGLRFSDGNMQSLSTNVYETNADFLAMPFERIYHEGSFDRSTEAGSAIVRSRCAEVLVPSPLLLDDRLEGIMCRSPAERETLLWHLGANRARWSRRTRVYTEPGLFQADYTYVETVDLSTEMLRWQMHPRRDGKDVEVAAEIRHIGSGRTVRSTTSSLNASAPWRIEHKLGEGLFEVSIQLEGCLAYKAHHSVTEQPF